MAVWLVLKLRAEMLEFLGPILDSPELISNKKMVLVCLILLLYLCVIA